MNREQKVSLSLVITTLVAIVASTVSIIILYRRIGMPEALRGLAFMGISGLGCLSMFIFKKDKGKVTFDERDRLIKERARLAGFTAAYLFTGMACMIPFFVLGPKAGISVSWLPHIFIGACITHFFFYSTTILCEYGLGSKGEKS
jgi:ABC-type maltose transport system permease subunit